MSLESVKELADRFKDSLSCLLEDTASRSLLLAVSGGSDSMALMHLAAAWAKEHDVPCSAVTVDHGLRAESVAEAEFVKSAAQELGLAHNTLRWNSGTESRGNLQKNARDARYGLIAEYVGDGTVVLTGHTLEDQGETFLLRLKRGSGLDGLSSISVKRYVHSGEGGYWLLRPLLHFKRELLQAFLRRHSVAWVSDASNEDMRFDRIKMRGALAQLKEVGIGVENIAATVSHLQRARDALDQEIRHFASKFCLTEHGDLLINRVELETLHSEFQYRLFAQSLKWVSSNPYRPRFGALKRVFKDSLHGKIQTIHGCLIYPQKTQIRISREFNAVANIRMDLVDEAVWDRRWKVQCTGTELSSRLTIAPLGPEGAKWVRAQGNFSLPFRTLQAHPGIYQGKEILFAPSLIENKHISATFCARPFEQSLGSY